MVERLEDVVDVVHAALRLVNIAGEVGVGRADVRVAVGAVSVLHPRHDEQAAPIATHGDHDGDVIARFVPRNGDVHALGGTDAVRVRAFVGGAHFIRPHAARIDDGSCRHGELVALCGAHDRTVGSAVIVVGDLDDLATIHDRCAEIGCGACDGDAQARVVDCRVVIEVSRRELLGWHGREVCVRSLCA